MGIENIACAGVCVSGCQCLSETVLDEDGGRCVLPQDCTVGKPGDQSVGCFHGEQLYEEGQEFDNFDGCNSW